MHHYKIYKFVYDKMISGQKTVEIRLLNEKSEKIKPGDTIEFAVVDQDLSLCCEVIDKYIYNNIDELWKNKEVLSSSSISGDKEEFIELMSEIFGRDNVLNSKIVGIKFKLI